MEVDPMTKEQKKKCKNQNKTFNSQTLEKGFLLFSNETTEPLFLPPLVYKNTF